MSLDAAVVLFMRQMMEACWCLQTIACACLDPPAAAAAAAVCSCWLCWLGCQVCMVVCISSDLTLRIRRPPPSGCLLIVRRRARGGWLSLIQGSNRPTSEACSAARGRLSCNA